MLTPRNVFLVDGSGALATALLTGIVLPAYHDLVGFPVSTLYVLGAIALCFSLYSLCCHFMLRHPRKQFLMAIMTANLLYCLVTAYLMFKYKAQLQTLGALYFTGEIVVVSVLCILEYRVLQGWKP